LGKYVPDVLTTFSQRFKFKSCVWALNNFRSVCPLHWHFKSYQRPLWGMVRWTLIFTKTWMGSTFKIFLMCCSQVWQKYILKTWRKFIILKGRSTSSVLSKRKLSF